MNKSTTFQRIASELVDIIDAFADKQLVEFKGRVHKMQKLQLAGKTLKNIPQACYATDSILKSALSPVGSIEEDKQYYSGKNHMYGYESEISVLVNGLALGCSNLHAGSVHDVDIFRSNI